MEGKIYAQIYSILRMAKEGLLDALKQLSEYGYNGIEAIGTNTEGLSVKEFKKYLSDLKLDPISIHSLKTEEDYAFAQEIGAQFADVRPSEGMKNRDEVLRAAEELNKKCLLHAKYGLKGVVHNHSTEFLFVPDDKENTIYDLFVQNTDPDLVGFELDVGWAQYAGINCGDLIRKYPGRFPVLHVKECARIAANEEEMHHFPKKVLDMNKPKPADADSKLVKGAPSFTPEQIAILYESRNWNVALGDGIIDWQDVKNAAEAQGVKAYINEREYYSFGGVQRTPIECAKLDYEFLRKL